MKNIVFVGNCQIDGLARAYTKFVAPTTNDKVTFLPSWTDLTEENVNTIQLSDLIVNQIQDGLRPVDLSRYEHNKEIVKVPLVSASFLWPSAGSAHIQNKKFSYLSDGPYPGELGDGFLNRLFKQGLAPDEALKRYQDHNFGGSSVLDRRLEINSDLQKSRDALCGFEIEQDVTQNFQTKYLFFSPHHPGSITFKKIAVQAFVKMNAPDVCLARIQDCLGPVPLPNDQLPIHPNVCDHFKLSYANIQTKYNWRGEGKFTWAEWVKRYMSFIWEPDLYEGTALIEKDTLRAFGLLDGVIKRIPMSPLAHSSMAKVLARLQQYEGAIQHIQKATEIAPDLPEVWRTAAGISFEAGKPDDAIMFAERAVRIDPYEPLNLTLLAHFQDKNGRLNEALDTRRKIVALKPFESTAMTDLGTTFRACGNIKEAFICYDTALGLDENNAGANFGLSLIQAQSGDVDAAIHSVIRAIALRDDIAPYYSHLGHLYARAGTDVLAVKAFEKALTLDPENAGLHHVISTVLSRLENRKKSLYHSKMAAGYAPSNVEFFYRYVDILINAGHISEATNSLITTSENVPRDVSFHTRISKCYSILGRHFEAHSHFKHLVRSANGNKNYIKDFISNCLKTDQIEYAIETLVELDIDPNSDSDLSELYSYMMRVKGGNAFNIVIVDSISISKSEILPSTQITQPRCLVYTNFPDLNPNFGKHHVDNIYVKRENWFPSVDLFELPAHTKLAVPSSEDFLPIVDWSVVKDQVRPNWTPVELSRAISRCEDGPVIEVEAVLVGRYGIRTWGHWLGELLPKIVLVEEQWPGRFFFILPKRFATDPVHKTGRDSLEYYGISESRILYVDELITYQFQRLFVVGSVWSEERKVHPQALQKMRGAGESVINPPLGWLKVVLLRRLSETRNVRNADWIMEQLIPDGWIVVDLETLSFRQQVEMFRNCCQIVSVLGSGISGILYCPERTKIITLAPSGWGDAFFYSIMQERNVYYSDVRGTTSQNNLESVATGKFTIPESDFLAALSAMRLVEDSSEGIINSGIGNSLVSNSLIPVAAYSQFYVSAYIDHEASMIGDSLSALPFIYELTKRFKRPVFVSGNFSPALVPLLVDMPIVIGTPPGGYPELRFNLKVKQAFDQAGEKRIHTSQSYFMTFGYEIPTVPIDLPLSISDCGLISGIVISPFSASEPQNSITHTRVWHFDRWKNLISLFKIEFPDWPIYVVGGMKDDFAEFKNLPVIIINSFGLDKVLSLILNAKLFLSIDSGLSHLAHFSGLKNHVLLYSLAVGLTVHRNPHADIINSWPNDIEVTQVFNVCKKKISPSSEFNSGSDLSILQDANGIL